MKIVNGKIAEATKDEMFDYYLTRDWDTIMPFREWLRRCEEAGTKVTDDGEKGSTFSKAEKTMTIWGSGLKKAEHAGLCSEERSMISPDYARNFIADFILGKPLGGRLQQQDLFAQEGENECS